MGGCYVPVGENGIESITKEEYEREVKVEVAVKMEILKAWYLLRIYAGEAHNFNSVGSSYKLENHSCENFEAFAQDLDKCEWDR